MKELIFKAVAVAAVGLVTAAVINEMGKPKKARQGHGRVAGFVPYDLRRPTGEAIWRGFWNPDDSRVFTPAFFGIGWTLNLWALLEKLGVFEPDVTEEHFLMPTASIREALVHVNRE